jgi:hypothetical protein
LDDALYTLNAAYTLPNVVKIFANFRPKSKANNTQTALSSQAIAGISLLAVPNLKAILELQLDKLDDFGETGKTNIFETFQYDPGSLSLGLWAAQWLSQADAETLALYVNPYIAYAFGPIVPRLDLGYGTGARAGFNNGNLNWHRQNYAPAYDSDVSVISIRPSVKFNIDSKTFVELGDLIDIDGVKDNPAWKGADSRISNVFYIDFKWAF